MSKLKNKKVGIAIIAVLALVVIAAFSLLGGKVPAEVAEVGIGDVSKIIKETGSVESHSAVTVYAKNTLEVAGLKVSEGDSVTKGGILMAGDANSSTKMEIMSIESQAAALQAQYKQAKDLAAKNKALYEEGALSYETYSQSQATANQLGNEVAALSYSAGSLAQATDANGIVAPIDGIITGLYVKDGETVAAGSQLFEISNLDDTYVKAQLIAEDADIVQVGDSVRVYNDDSGLNDTGATVTKVHLKAQEIMSELGIYQKRVIVEIDLSEGVSARLGSDVDIEITVDTQENCICVDQGALFKLDGDDYVYVVEAGKAVLRAVEVGLEGEDYVQVLSGLSEGETVINSPGDEIEEGVRVSAK